MAIPDYQSLMLPLLKYSADGREHHIHDATGFLADQFKLTEEERHQLLPSGRQVVFRNRVGWARTYLKKAGLLESERRGYFNITRRGLDVLSENPPEITDNFLKRYPEFLEFKKPKETPISEESGETEQSETPEEKIEVAFQQINADLALELLETVQNCSPQFFERVVVDLIVKMGYGGTRKDAGQAIGKSGDQGIDGIIKEDRLGLDIVYIQAKKWDPDKTIGSPEIHKFAGALMGQAARKGIFITTAKFSAAARDYVTHIDSKIVLIDGEELAQLMIDHNLGVNIFNTYDLKRIDTDYFSED